MSFFFFWVAVGCLAMVVYASFFEWMLHRFVMHRPLGKFDYSYKAHALVHHRIFRADHTYHLVDEKDKATIPMAWWNGPVLVLVVITPFVLAAWLLQRWGLAAGALLACAAYYGTYEYLHWCMHLPRRRALERSGIFFRLNGHHILHHRYMGKNFNVVLPLADLLLGTLLLRARITFAQPVGPSVPDVQPLAKPRPMALRVLRFVRLCFTGVKG